MPDNQGMTWPDDPVANWLHRGNIFPSVIGGSKTSYRRVWDLLWEKAAKARGLMKVQMAAGESLVPPLSVHDVLALITMWNEATGRAPRGGNLIKTNVAPSNFAEWVKAARQGAEGEAPGVVAFPWFEYARRAFGQVKFTDRYVVDATNPKHAQRPFHAVAGPAMLGAFWFDTRELADKLDAVGTVQRELKVDQSAGMRDRIAKRAWNEQQRIERENLKRPGGIVPVPQPELPKTPLPAPPAPPAATGDSGWMWLLLIAGGLYVVGKDNRRRR